MLPDCGAFVTLLSLHGNESYFHQPRVRSFDRNSAYVFNQIIKILVNKINQKTELPAYLYSEKGIVYEQKVNGVMYRAMLLL